MSVPLPPPPPPPAPSAASPPAPAPLAIIDWGRTAYPDALARQIDLVAQRLAGTLPDTLVFTEHDPVYTLGLRRDAATHLLWDAPRLAAAGIAVLPTNRGGDITYHGPGQLVGYPIVDLSPVRDLHAYLRFLEQVLINAVGALGLVATRRDGLTGIWIADRKVAAIGVAVRRWVAYHGFALNVAPDLTHFAGIIPCGITAAEGTVTTLAAELPAATPTLPTVQTLVAQSFTNLWPTFLTSKM